MKIADTVFETEKMLSITYVAAAVFCHIEGRVNIARIAIASVRMNTA